jgi:alpha,alpha-trehalase
MIGFGWTNGVVLYLAGEYGQYLAPVSCPLIPIVEIEGYPGSNATSPMNGTESTSTSTNGTEPMMNTTEIGEGGVQNTTQARVFAGYRIPRQ